MDLVKQKRRVLIITYYWPPSGGAGVQRWLKFSKYLRGYGWEPVIYTPSNPEAPAEDHSLFTDIPEDLEVLKTEIWEPYTWYKKFIGQKSHEKVNAGFLSENKKPGLAEKTSVWIRGNFFIPDARKFWIKPSVRFLINYLKDHPVDAMISTGPPHSMHLIAEGIKQKINIPWLADFRDPWTQIDFFDQLKLTTVAKNIHKRQEKSVLQNADTVVTVSHNWAKDLKTIVPREIVTITNGFDPDDFKGFSVEIDKDFTLTHIGSLNKDRNPRFLWETIREICNENPAFASSLKLQFIGKTDFQVFEYLEELGLSKYAVKIAYMPHAEVLKKTASSAALLLLINNTPNSMGIIPGKVFEYIASQRPVLCIAPPEGDSAGIVRAAGAGYVVDFNDNTELKDSLIRLFTDFSSGKSFSGNSDYNKYSRKQLCSDIAAELNKLLLK